MWMDPVLGCYSEKMLLLTKRRARIGIGGIGTTLPKALATPARDKITTESNRVKHPENIGFIAYPPCANARIETCHMCWLGIGGSNERGKNRSFCSKLQAAKSGIPAMPLFAVRFLSTDRGRRGRKSANGGKQPTIRPKIAPG